MQKLSVLNGINFYLFDTTNKSQREISFDVVDTILKNMKDMYLSRVNNNKELIRNK